MLHYTCPVAQPILPKPHLPRQNQEPNQDPRADETPCNVLTLLTDFQRTILKRMSHGDWLLLMRILDNVNSLERAVLIEELETNKEYN